jgi:hypothetical protein
MIPESLLNSEYKSHTVKSSLLSLGTANTHRGIQMHFLRHSTISGTPQSKPVRLALTTKMKFSSFSLLFIVSFSLY